MHHFNDRLYVAERGFRHLRRVHLFIVRPHNNGRATDIGPENRELLAKRLTESVRASVETELKRRYSWIAVIAVLLTSGVIVGVFNSVLLDTRVGFMATKKI